MNASQAIGLSVLAALATLGRARAAIVASWDFEEGSGETVHDGVGGLNAIQAGGTWMTTGDYNGALGTSLQLIRSQGDRVLASYSSQFAGLTSATFEAWVKCTGGIPLNQDARIFNMPGADIWYYNDGDPGGSGGLRMTIGGPASGYLWGNPLTLNMWTQVVATYDAGTGNRKLYVNGVPSLTATGGTGLALSGNAPIAMGNDITGHHNFDGLIDHVSIHNVALTPAQVLARYQLITEENSPSRYDTWQANRPLTVSAWGTHRYQGGEVVNMGLFGGSGLNTFGDNVRSGSASSEHPYTSGLPSLVEVYSGAAAWPGTDLPGFIADFNQARSRQNNMIGVVLGDEIPDASRAHFRAVRDWIVNNPDPSISSMQTFHSNYPEADWEGLYSALKFDAGILQVYPFNRTVSGTYDAAYHYNTLQWWSDWTKSKHVGMWVYTQNYAFAESGRISDSELRLQRYAALAYGAKGIVDFLWSYNPGDQWAYGGYATDAGVPSPTYPIVAPINEETQRIGAAMVRLDHISTVHRNNAYAMHWEDRPEGWDLLNVTSTANGNNLLVSYFLDPEGEQYWMVVNKDRSKTLTAAQLAVDVTMSFNPSVQAIQWLRPSDGMIQNIPIVGGTYTFSLWGGTGNLFKFSDGAPFLVAQPTWNVNSSGDWNTNVSWGVGSVPNGVGATANFMGVISAPQTVFTNSAITLGAIKFDNANSYQIAGQGSLTLQVSSGSALVEVQRGSHQINLPMVFASDTNIAVAGGASLKISNPAIIKANKTVTASGNVVIDALLKIETGGVLNIGAGPAITLFGAPNLADGAKIDVTNNSVIIDYAGESSPLAGIQAQVASGFSGGAWTGGGITSTDAAAAAASLSNSRTAVGFADNAVLHFATFGGQAVDDTAILVRYTYSGDSNLDGKVNTLDFNTLAGNFGLKSKTWVDGDYSFDGTVDSLDFNAFAVNFGQTLPLSLGTVVPDPTSFSLVALVAVGCRTRRFPMTGPGNRTD